MKFSAIFSKVPEQLANIEITGIADDSRKVEPGNVFVCVRGAESDGHLYAKKAIENGAVAVICERNLELHNQVIVGNSHKALIEISDAFYSYPLKKLKVIGVTGTNGKTSVCYMLKSILEHCGYKTGMIGTIENIVGDTVIESGNTTPGPLALRKLFAIMVENGCTHAVMEVSSHALDQGRVDGIVFEAGIFTNLTQDHLDYHKTMEAYFEAKSKLFCQSKLAVINMDDPVYEKLISKIKIPVVTYSLKSNESTYTAKNPVYRPNGVDYEIVGFGIIGRIHLKIAGKFSVYNSMAAAACAKEMGLPINEIADSLNQMKGVKGRAEVVDVNDDYTVIIDYAHTPDGLQKILSTFKECPKNRLVVLFGCGGDRDKTKRPKMGAIAARLADYVIVTSDNPRTEDPLNIIEDILAGMKGISTPYKVIENRIEAIHYAIKRAKRGDIIILAGKGHETYQILGKEKVHLDEREVIAEALKNK